MIFYHQEGKIYPLEILQTIGKNILLWSLIGRNVKETQWPFKISLWLYILITVYEVCLPQAFAVLAK